MSGAGPDYGAVRMGRGRIGLWIAVGLAILVVAGLFGANLVYSRHKAVATAAEWRIDGAPCPTLTQAAYAVQPYRPGKAFAYDDIQIARVAGHVSCNEVHEAGGVGLGKFVECQFTSPNMLLIKTPRGETIFNPGMGQSATVMVRDGEPRCVLASNFKLGD